MTKNQNFRDNRSKPCTSLLMAEIFDFFVILNGFAMVLAGVFGFFDFLVFPMVRPLRQQYMSACTTVAVSAVHIISI